jgi:pantoate--beta-alanine ligase
MSADECRLSVISAVSGLRELLREQNKQGRTVGLVPTMGALHAGHRQLIETARRDCDVLVVSIFVNPLQFDRPDDLVRYPRTFEADCGLCQSAGADIIFAPTVADLYPEEQKAFVDVPELTGNLCGGFRPGHFRGVATVVMKLFGIVRPDRAYFGQKDAQQLAVITRMVQDLNVPVVVVPVPTVREADGLALSSRNKHLSAAERQIAPALYRALSLASAQVASGERSAALIRENALRSLHNHPELRVEYLELVHPSTLQPISDISGSEITGPVLIAIAAWLGSTRLIDNVLAVGGNTLYSPR